jgi:hypothetical protein
LRRFGAGCLEAYRATRPLRLARFWALFSRLRRWSGETLTEEDDMKTPDALVTMRLSDMTRMHPAQDDSHVCAECGRAVGLYPSGQAALRKFPTMKIICAVCATKRPASEIENIAAADFDTIMAESRESFDVGKA